MEFENVLPEEIEKRSFEIIGLEMITQHDEKLLPIIKRVIHTTADFDYEQNLYFSNDAYDRALAALKNGATIITDTNMGKSGINKAALEKLGCKVCCFMADADVAELAKKNGTTRAVASMDKSVEIEGPKIYAIGNAPTALIRLDELIREGKLAPDLIIAVPVGFVNVVQAKELIVNGDVPCIVARGRKGGSNVAAAIVNAIMYILTRN